MYHAALLDLRAPLALTLFLHNPDSLHVSIRLTYWKGFFYFILTWPKDQGFKKH